MDDRRIDGIDPDQVLAQRRLYRSEWPPSARLEKNEERSSSEFDDALLVSWNVVIGRIRPRRAIFNVAP